MKENANFRHQRLSIALVIIALISAIIAGVTGFVYNLYLPSAICMGVTVILIAYVSYCENQF